MYYLSSNLIDDRKIVPKFWMISPASPRTQKRILVCGLQMQIWRIIWRTISPVRLCRLFTLLFDRLCVYVLARRYELITQCARPLALPSKLFMNYGFCSEQNVLPACLTQSFRFLSSVIFSLYRCLFLVADTQPCIRLHRSSVHPSVRLSASVRSSAILPSVRFSHCLILTTKNDNLTGAVIYSFIS